MGRGGREINGNKSILSAVLFCHPVTLRISQQFIMASDSQGPVVVGISIAFAIVTFVVFSLRMFARVVVLKNVGVDDCKFVLCKCWQKAD
jgi:hypothetical protein